MSVLVLSIDFDGCLAHQSFTESAELDLIKFNQPFLRYLQEIGQTYQQQCLMIGSSRQSGFIDFMSQKNNRQLLRCFPYYIQVANHLGINLEPFLMADLYSNLAPGTAYNLELAVDYPFPDKGDFAALHLKALEFQGSLRNPLSPDAFCDSSKISLLYAQMHFMAQKHQDKELVFKFYDDNSQQLTYIHRIFKENNTLLPSNLSLDLCHYDGQEMKDLFHLKGSGQIDADCYQTIIGIKKSARLSHWENTKDLSYCFNPNIVRNVDLVVHESRLSHPQQAQLIQCLVTLYRKAKALEQRHEDLAAKVAFALHRDLTHLFYQFQNAKISLQDLTQGFQARIDDAKPVLAKHRGWKEVLINLIAALLMLGGLGYLMVAAIKHDLLLFKVKTDSLHKIESIEQELMNIK